ncbi:restriction endonuclease subunit S [Tenacibaculum maritimum]|uniref:restriction endonuclease subunit S n=1 Tax=Tenacibaculum maritimum TaxID=107401 RepID=UPI0012E49AAC|nr:restriction endonuclease subunit S [Tenacibaculum maritimum]CAA0210785.1 Type I restriction enzyme S subunit [Tenacibaculum maritimum]
MELTTKQGFKQTEVGLIPEDWEVFMIEDVSSVVGGGTPSTKVSSYWNGSIEWFTPTEISNVKYSYSSVRKITKEGLNNSSAQILPKGAILMTTRASIGDLSILQNEACTNQGFQSLIAKDIISNEYLYYLMLTNRVNLLRNASGSTFLEISPKKIKSIKIPLPPTLKEQKAIATALSDVDDLIVSLEGLIAKKQAIKQGAMQQLLIPPHKGGKRLPGFSGEWVEKELGELGQFKNGVNKGAEDFGHGKPFINLLDVFGIPSISSGKSLGLINSTPEERKIYDLKKGDVLFVRSSVKPSGVGLTTVIIDDLINSVFSGFLIRFRDNNTLNLTFKIHCFHSKEFRDKVISSSSSSANTNINQEALSSLTIWYPPTDSEQKAIAKILSDMDTELEQLETKKAKYQQLKQGMLQELLTGNTRLV